MDLNFLAFPYWVLFIHHVEDCAVYPWHWVSSFELLNRNMVGNCSQESVFPSLPVGVYVVIIIADTFGQVNCTQNSIQAFKISLCIIVDASVSFGRCFNKGTKFKWNDIMIRKDCCLVWGQHIRHADMVRSAWSRTLLPRVGVLLSCVRKWSLRISVKRSTYCVGDGFPRDIREIEVSWNYHIF